MRPLIVLMGLSLLLPACEPERRPVSVLLVGLDGADWDVIDPLAEAGYLPTIGALVAAGARADLDCEPAFPTFSCFCPPVWTSLMTGQPASVHRMFAIEDRADERAAPALWTLNGRRGGVNTLVSVRNSWPFEAEVTWGLSEPGVEAASAELFARWAPPPPHPAFDEPDTLTKPVELFRIVGLLPARGERLPAWGPFAKDRAATGSMSTVALLTRFTSLLMGRSELVVVIFHSTDKSSHVNWGSIQAVPGGPIDTQALLAEAEGWDGPVFVPAPFGFGTVASQYLEADRWLGELLAQTGYDYVVLASDHGMGRNPYAGLAGIHGPTAPEAHIGILSITGAGVLAGADLEASVLDVAPTLAYLMNIPVAENLPGRVLEEAIVPDHLAHHPIRTTPTW